MKRLALLATAALATFLFTGCGENGDKAIAYGDGLGQEWAPPAGAKQMRISADNSFTRRIVVVAEAPGVHYEMTVRPIRERYMIIPEGNYTITAFTEQRSTGMTKLWVNPDNRNGGKGLLVKIRP